MTGGSLLGKGAYGCAFRPPLLCKGEGRGARPYQSTGDLTKVSLKADAEREAEMGKMIQTIPLWQNYYAPVLTACDVAAQQRDKDADDCDILQETPSVKLKLLSMTFGGDPLVNVDLQRIKTADDFWVFAKHLLEGVALLTLNGVVHRDMHRGNILVDKYLVGRIIDFGISVKYNDNIRRLEEELLHEFDPHYTQEPPEYNWWVTKTPSARIGDVLKKKPAILNTRSVLGVKEEDQREEALEFFEKSRSFIDRDFGRFWRAHWSKYDSWSIGGALVSVLKNLLIGPSGKAIDGSPRMAAMKKVLRGLLHINPFLRLDAVNALALWDPENRIIARYGHKWIAATRAAAAK